MNKKEVIKLIIDNLRDIAGDYSADQYEKYLNTYDDEGFDKYMDRLDSGEEQFVIEAPVFDGPDISFENNLKIARSLGYDFYDELIYESDRPGVPDYKSAVKCLVLWLPIKRPVQMAYKKISAPTNYSVVNELTGQVTGRSKGASITTPEIMLLGAMPLDDTMEELLKGRGGDKGMQDAMYANLVKTGNVTLEGTRPFATGVKSIATFGACLKSMHIATTNLGD